jgi:hypothetical protein
MRVHEGGGAGWGEWGGGSAEGAARRQAARPAPPRRAGVGTMAACPGARRPPQEAPPPARGAGRGGARVCALRQLVRARTHLQMLALTGLTISCQYHCGSRLMLLLRCLNIGNH